MALKVLHVINGLGPGGAERSLAEMLPGLKSRNIDSAIVCFNRREKGVEADVLGTTDVRFLRSRRLPGRVVTLRRIVAELHPGLIHTTIAESNLAGRLAAIGTGIPVLTSLVNTPYAPVRFEDPNIHPLLLRTAQVVDRATAHLSAHFHAITHAVKADAVATLGIRPERITVIERGRDPVRLGRWTPERRAETRRRLGLCEDDKVIINVGRQEYQKGQSYLLEAFGLVASRFPDAVLLLAGRAGAATSGLQRRYKRHPAHARIQFLGHRDDIPDLLVAADVFAFPSLFEGLGGVLIEAMALRLPVVASDIPAIREVVETEGNAFLVPAASAQHLAEALSALLADQLRREAFGMRGRAIFEERFTLDRSTAAMAALYARVVGRGVDPAQLDAPPSSVLSAD